MDRMDNPALSARLFYIYSKKPFLTTTIEAVIFDHPRFIYTFYGHSDRQPERESKTVKQKIVPGLA